MLFVVRRVRHLGSGDDIRSQQSIDRGEWVRAPYIWSREQAERSHHEHSFVCRPPTCSVVIGGHWEDVYRTAQKLRLRNAKEFSLARSAIKYTRGWV